MIYIVTGLPRSGTSMLMQALEAGGMRVARSDKRDQLIAKTADENYRMNPVSLYEPDDVMAEGFPLQHEGCAVKVVMPRVTEMPRGQYRIVAMRRDSEEIAQSSEAAYGGKVIEQRRGLKFGGIRLRTIRADEVAMVAERSLDALRARDDVLSLTELWYDDVLENPVRELNKLSWGFDVEKAAAVVNPMLKRFKLAELIPGVAL